MHALKKVSFWLSMLLLSVFLVLFLVVTPVSMHLTNRESVKGWLTDPGVIDGFGEILPTMLSDAIEDSDAAVVQLSENTVGIDKEQLIAATRGVLTTEYIGEKIEPVIDGVYDWLEGKTSEPEFDVSLNDRITAVVNSIKGPLTSELEKLPTCPSNVKYDSDFNPINALCVPPGVDVDYIVKQFSSQVTGESSDLDVHVSSEDIEFDEDVLEVAPRVYSGVDAMPIAFAMVAFLFAVAAVLLADDIKKGLRRVSWILIVDGILAALSFWLLTRINTFGVAEGGEEIDKLIFDEIVTPLAKRVASDIGSTGVFLSLGVAALGLVIWLAAHVHGKVKQEQTGGSKKIKDTTPTERQESRYVNKISGKSKKKK